MADKRYYWIKLKQDFYENNDTIDFLMGQKNGSEYIVLYQMLCLKTVNSGGKLCSHIGEMIIPYNIDKIVRECKYFSFDTVALALELYKKLGLIYEQDDNCLAIANFDNFIGSESDSAERVRKHRTNKALQCNNNVTECNVTNSEQCNIDIEYRYKSKDIEKNKDKEESKNSSNADLLSYNQVIEIAKIECPTCYNRFQKKIDSGKIEYASRLQNILDDLQGQMTYEDMRQLFRHANKTYIVSPNYQQLDLLWVLSNIEKIKAIEEKEIHNNAVQNEKQVTQKTAAELNAIFGDIDPNDI